MGAWGVGIYDNDAAADWAGELPNRGVALIASALRAAFDDGYLDADVGAHALAAADVLGRLRTGDVLIDSEHGPGSWILTQAASPSDELLQLAERAVDRVVGPESEIVELWRETDDFDAWLATVRTVVGRLV